jgi:sec-independent protein translocase protein TatB
LAPGFDRRPAARGDLDVRSRLGRNGGYCRGGARRVGSQGTDQCNAHRQVFDQGGEFQSGVNEIVREADLEDTKKKLTELQSISKNSIQKAVEKAVDPTGEIKTAMKVEETPPAVAAAPKVEAVEAKPAEAPAAEPSTTEPSTTESSTAETAAQETTTEETAADKFETVEPAPQKDPAA